MTDPMTSSPDRDMKPCPFCDGPTKAAFGPSVSSELVRHVGQPHCPVMRCAITREQWNTRITSKGEDGDASPPHSTADKVLGASDA